MYNKHTQQSSHISMAHPNWTNCKIYKLFKAAYNLISVMVESFKVVQPFYQLQIITIQKSKTL